jgi:hypothetical protein
VERNSITLAVDDDGAKPERTDGLFRRHNFAALRRYRGNRIVLPAIGVNLTSSFMIMNFPFPSRAPICLTAAFSSDSASLSNPKPSPDT